MAQFEIFRKDRVLYLKMFGQMDNNASKAYLGAVRSQLPALGDNWASIIDLQEWQLHVPEVQEGMKELHIWLTRNGHTAEVCITGSSSLKKMARKKLLEVSDSNIELEYVSNEEQAWDWVRERGYLDEAPEIDGADNRSKK